MNIFSKVKSKEEIEDGLKYPFVPYENLLIEMIESIEEIYLEHEIFCDFLLHGEHGKSVAQMVHRYDLLERDIFEIQEAYNDCIKIPESKEKEIEELEIKRVELKRKIEDTVGSESSIFEQLNNLNCFIELKKIGINIPMQDEENNDVVLCVKYIRNILDEYSKIESPTLDDAKDTFKKLLIYDSKVDVFKNVSTLEESEIEIRKIYVEQFNRIESCMISMYDKHV